MPYAQRECRFAAGGFSYCTLHPVCETQQPVNGLELVLNELIRGAVSSSADALDKPGYVLYFFRNSGLQISRNRLISFDANRGRFARNINEFNLMLPLPNLRAARSNRAEVTNYFNDL